MPKSRTPPSLLPLLLMGVAIIAFALFVTRLGPENPSRDTRSRAAALNKLDLRLDPSRGTFRPGDRVDTQLTMVRISTDPLLVRGVTAVMQIDSSIRVESASCLAPFTFQPVVTITPSNLTILCSVPLGPQFQMPDAPVSVASIRFTIDPETTSTSGRISFDKNNSVITQQGPTGTTLTYDLSNGGTDAVYTIATSSTPTGTVPTDRPVNLTPPPVYQETCDRCGWCNRDIYPTPPSTWTACRACLYDAEGNLIPNTSFTVLGCAKASSADFVQTTLSTAFGVIGGIAFIAILIGIAILMTSAGNPVRIRLGKDIITSAIVGLLLIIFSVFLLRVIGVDILGIPNLG